MSSGHLLGVAVDGLHLVPTDDGSRADAASHVPAPTIVTFTRRLLKLSGANDGELVIVVPGEALA